MDMPPPLSVQALMLGIAVLLGAGIGRTLFSPRFPNEVLGLTIGFAPIGWLLAIVGALILRDPTDESGGARPFPNWRAMEYMGWGHLVAIALGFVLLVVFCKLSSRIGNAVISFKAILLSGVILLICFVLINTSGFVATLVWAGKGWTALPMIGYIIFAAAGLAVCLGILRNQLSADGPRWLRRSS